MARSTKSVDAAPSVFVFAYGFTDTMLILLQADVMVPSRPQMYRLVSVVQHFGNSGSGHYTVYRKVRGKIGDEDHVGLLESALEQWFCISDSQVDSVSEKEVLEANASLLFYEKIDHT